MKLSQKLEADYCELAADYLDNLRINSVEDFTCVKEALQNLLNKNSEAPPSLQERVSDIKELLDSKEIYVEDPRNYKAYKKIIKNKIRLKIKEIEDLTVEQKNVYIENLEKKKENGLEYQNKVKDMHVIQSVVSEETMLMALADQFDREDERQMRLAAEQEEASSSNMIHTLFAEIPVLKQVFVAYYIQSILLLNHFYGISR